MTVNRRTSNYTLHLPGSTPADLDRLTQTLPPITDRQTHGLTFRATDDETACRVSARAMDEAGLPEETQAHLTTGLGIHRRTVAAV